MAYYFRQENKELVKKMNDDGELALCGLILTIEDTYGLRKWEENIAYEIADVFLECTMDYSIKGLHDFLRKIEIWQYDDFQRTFNELAMFYKKDDLLDIVGTIYDIECYWTNDYDDDLYVICYDYPKDLNIKDIHINIIGSYMECERLLTLLEHEIVSAKDVDDSIDIFNQYLNNYLGDDWNVNQYSDEFEYCNKVLDRIDQLLGGVL